MLIVIPFGSLNRNNEPNVNSLVRYTIIAFIQIGRTIPTFFASIPVREVFETSNMETNIPTNDKLNKTQTRQTHNHIPTTKNDSIV